MPRGVQRQRHQPFPVAEATTALALQRSPAQLRLEALEKDHERLLKDIAKKKAARDATEHAARDAQSALEARVRPVREAFMSTVNQLRQVFKALLGSESRLNRRDKAKVRRLYAQVLPDLAAEGEDRADAPNEDHDFNAGPFSGGQPRPSPDTDAGYSATKPSEKNASSLRALFRKLAVALHPDKVQDAKEREMLTSVMKDVTRAYESGDVARLVEIEREWLAAPPPRDRDAEVEWRVAQLLQANKELRRQLRALTAELKELRESLPGVPSTTRRGARNAVDPAARVEQMVGELERELGELQVLRDFAQSFLDDEIDLTEFLMGPPVAMGEEDPFEQFLAEMMEEMGRGGPRRRGPASRDRRRR